MLSMFINFTDQKTSVALPYNSEFIKLAIRPKNNPIGATREIKSKKIKF